MRLMLGFENIAYGDRYTERSPLAATTKKRKPKKLSAEQQAYGAGKTTVDVAQELEKKYKIVETFCDMEEDLIGEIIQDVFADTLEAQLAGHPFQVRPEAAARIETRFRRNLSGRRYDGMIPGVPTLTAQAGVSHLYKKPYAARSSRPSFIDTGMYQRSFRAWFEEN